jgi:hemoglobin/transferrin/lactoferrin receptor protein
MGKFLGRALAVSLCGTTLHGAVAQVNERQEVETELDAITVSAERTPTKVFDSPSTVSVRDAREIEEKNIQSPRDLVRDEPGVSVGNQPSRTGSTNYVIRGIGENRVRLQVDGIKIPDYPGTNFGPGTYTRDFVDFDTLKQVEIIRGPASALYGSDAIGGVVSYVTKDPADYLAFTPRNWFVSAKAAYDSTDRSFSQTVTGAARSGAWESLIVYTHRQGHEVTPNTWRKANPQDYDSHSVLGKLIYDAGEWGRVRLTGEFTHRQVETDLRTERSAAVLNSLGQDTTSRPRVSLDWTLPVNWAMADLVKTTAFFTEIDRSEQTRQWRVSGAPSTTPNRYRFSDFGFHQQIAGAEVQLEANRTWGDWSHRIIYGATIDHTTTTRPRNRTETNLVTGVTTNFVGLEQFPNKNFPDTETTQGALYVQDTISNGRLRIIPALRADFYSLTPKPDQAFANSNQANFTVEKLNTVALSPKFGLTYDVTDTYRLFAQYARGFRAPPYDNANFGYSNPAFGYEILPNGNLKPETSNSFEAGLRGRFENGSSFQLTGFYNMYSDFIESVVIGNSPGGLQQFQFRNLSSVVIWGLEAKGSLKVSTDWTVFANAAFQRGEDEDTGLPIDSVDPFTGLVGVRYQASPLWGIEARQRFVAGKTRVSSPTIYRPGGYGVTDFTAFYNPTPNITINANVYNIFDRSYFNAQDVRGLLTTNPNLELFRSPGRTFALNATVRW